MVDLNDLRQRHPDICWEPSKDDTQVCILDINHETPHGWEKRVTVGTVLYGFCGGFFGRDSYGNKTVEAIGKDWVVAREDGLVDYPVMAHCNPEILGEYTVMQSW